MGIQLTLALEQDLQYLAAQSNTSVDDFAQRALEEFVAYRRDLNESVGQVHGDFKADDLLEHHEVVVGRMERLFGQRDAFRAAIREGIAAGERGELVEHEEVVAMLNDIIDHG